jgi:hypothetical protein
MPPETRKFKVDENLPEAAAEILRAAGFDAETVLNEGLGGASDSSLASVCLEERRALQHDLDFSDIEPIPRRVSRFYCAENTESQHSAHLRNHGKSGEMLQKGRSPAQSEC